MQAGVYSIKLLIRYKIVKGKLVFGVGQYNRGIFQSFEKELLDFLFHYC